MTETTEQMALRIAVELGFIGEAATSSNIQTGGHLIEFARRFLAKQQKQEPFGWYYNTISQKMGGYIHGPMRPDDRASWIPLYAAHVAPAANERLAEWKCFDEEWPGGLEEIESALQARDARLARLRELVKATTKRADVAEAEVAKLAEAFESEASHAESAEQRVAILLGSYKLVEGLLTVAKAKLAALESRVALLEHDMKYGDYETLYAQTVDDLRKAFEEPVFSHPLTNEPLYRKPEEK